jgi:tetratricopeptide (TPR) repeat protein
MALRAVTRDDPRNGLRPADALLIDGRYHEALAAYQSIVRASPDFAPGLARLGMVQALRGERSEATVSLAGALGKGLQGGEADAVRLYQGVVATQEGAQPAAFWSRIPASSPFYGARLVLTGAYLLQGGDYPGAEQALRDALLRPMAPAWQAAAHTQLALLRASSDPGAALAELDRANAPAGWPAPAPAAVWLAGPLAPRADDSAALRAALAEPPDMRALKLGQFYLGRELFGLAEAQFDAVPGTSQQALPAAAYAAYTRWRAGDRAGGLERLRALAEAYPGESRARALLAVAALASSTPDETRAQLALVSQLAPSDPATQLAWGQWYVTQRDYVAAAAAYARGLSLAPPTERGIYALHLARFHIATGLELCEQGLPAGEQAAALRAGDPQAWLALTQLRSACGDTAGAVAAASRAVALAPQAAEALYRYGRALHAAGDLVGARQALIRAADAQPASAWRARAEQELASF